MYLKTGERIDDLHRKGYKIIQNPSYFCFGIDAVLLAHFSKTHKNEKHIDLCCGNGIVSLLMEARYEALCFNGLEVQTNIVDIARRNVKLNNISSKTINIFECDIKNVPQLFACGTYDVATANPPYMTPHDLKNDNKEKSIARHEVLCSLFDVCAAASHLLKDGGKFFMIHKPSRLADIISSLQSVKLEPKIMRSVYPKVHKAPCNILIMATKGGKPSIKVLPPLIIYDDNHYTKEVQEIYYGK